MINELPEHGQVFQGHLAGAVFSDGHSGVGAGHVHVRLANHAHPGDHLTISHRFKVVIIVPKVVKSSGEKARECGGEGHGAIAASQADGDLNN